MTQRQTRSAGRPLRYNEPTVKRTLRLPVTLDARLRTHANKLGVSRSQLMTAAAKLALRPRRINDLLRELERYDDR